MLPEQITAGARTVVDLTAHFGGLKERARELRQRFGARDRGFFTPTEDEEVRHLLVSYWQSRAALFDLVLSVHRELETERATAEEEHSMFLVGYAAAVVLVDAARFLGEMFDDSDVVRAKLNEPEPHFGIPEGTYDTVQKSLTDPYHAWHLHQASRYIREDDLLILDGTEGVVLVDPDDRIQTHYRKRQKREKRYYAGLSKLKKAPAVTRDGIAVELQANVELPKDFDAVRKVGATGVGLYRTEFLYMNRESPPDEEEHFRTYADVLGALKGIPVTIRTLDLGADKQVDGGGRQSGPVPSNPALGLRAIRLCLKEPSLFRPQLRAIIRASSLGPVRMMIPMLSNIQEMSQVLEMVGTIRDELKSANIKFDPDMAIGGMIEVPAAAICADVFASDLDFLSIGTNDLIQYTMAIDRVSDEVNYLYDPLHPAVLRLIYTTLQAGQKAKIPVAMCGEMAGDTRYTRLLLGLGLREFSVHPAALLEVKQIIIDSRVDELTYLAKKALKSRSGTDVAQLTRHINQ